MSKSLFFIFFFSLVGFAHSQQNILDDYEPIIIQSIGADAEDFSDLLPLKELWANKKYIFLGEQSHGEGATFEARVRLIKFLHQEMGFDMVAFESGLYDNYHAYNQVKNDKSTTSSPFNKSILTIWSATAENQKLIKYVEASLKNKNSLQIAGFDFIRNENYRVEFSKDLKALLVNKFTGSQLSQLEDVILSGADLLVENEVDTSEFFILTKDIQAHLDLNAKDQTSEHSKMMAQAFESWSFGLMYDLGMLQGVEYKVQNPRDQQMAENFLFLTELYPEKKIIGIGASYHFSNEVTNFQLTDTTSRFIQLMDKETKAHEPFDLNKALSVAVPMGQLLKRELGEEMYSLSFSSFEGKYGQIGNEPYQIFNPPLGSIERALKETDFAIVDFSNRKEDNWFYSSLLGNLPLYANWSSIVDGVFFVKKSYPPTPIEYNDVEQMESSKNGLYGIVIDEESEDRIPFVNISIEGTARGTNSNENGVFVFNTTNSLDQNLVFSSIGYQNDTIWLANYINSDDLIINLKPKRYLLQEVVIRKKALSAEEIVQLALKKRDNNYFQEPLNQEFFFSNSTFLNDDSIIFNEEAAVLIYGENGYKSTNRVASQFYGDIIQLRNTTGNPSKDRWSGVGSLWESLGHNIIFDKANVLNRTKAYELSLIGLVQFEDQLVYEIEFVCNKPNATTIGYGYPAPESAQGKIFINSSDFAVVKYEVCVSRTKFMDKKHNIESILNHRLIQTFKRFHGKYFLNTSYKFDHYSKTKLDDQATWTIGELSILNSTNILTDNLQVIEKPILNLAIAKKKEEDLEFWKTYNHMIIPKIPNFGCSE